jgi:hypothetical protein
VVGPTYVWAVASDGSPVEAILENEQKGEYHGYPMIPSDPLREKVVKAWEKA